LFIRGSDSRETLSSAEAPKPKSGTKKQRKWDDSNVNATEVAELDYSGEAPSQSVGSAKELIDPAALGTRSKTGLYEVADYVSPSSQPTESSTSRLSNLFSRLGLSKRPLTEADLAPALEAMRNHLKDKNIAHDVAEKLVSGVGASLAGVQVSGINGAEREVRNAMESTLTRILTPRTSTDILHEIRRKRANGRDPDPYALTFVGVNGVGKSTNLSKVAFWLLQNGLKVLVAACDTFRSGAVEQLAVHVRNLSQLESQGGGKVELYQRGYGKDSAGIARDAITFAKKEGFDVVMIDTAGRMQDNEPLMRALAKVCIRLVPHHLTSAKNPALRCSSLRSTIRTKSYLSEKR
jgi:signal recognition particle receptor subunit alpha